MSPTYDRRESLPHVELNYDQGGAFGDVDAHHESAERRVFETLTLNESNGRGSVTSS